MVKLIPAVRLFPWVDNVLRCSRDYKQLLLVLTSHNENGNNENCCSVFGFRGGIFFSIRFVGVRLLLLFWLKGVFFLSDGVGCSLGCSLCLFLATMEGHL